MPHSSPHKAQVEPVAALAAVLALTAVMGIATGVVGDAIPDRTESPPTDVTLTRIVQTLSSGSVLDPLRLTDDLLGIVAPHGYTLHVTIRVDDRIFTAGPSPPSDAPTSTRSVPVRLDRGVAPGRIQVVLWS